MLVSVINEGIYVIDTREQRLVPEDRTQIGKSLSSDHVRDMLLDVQRHLWLWQEGDEPLVILDADTFEPAEDIRWSPELQRCGGRLHITAWAEDPVTRDLLISSATEGYLVYETLTRTLRKARGAAAGASASSILYNSQSGDARSFLLGSETGGLLRFDIATESIGPGWLPSFRRDFGKRKVNAMLEDNQGNIWLGLYQVGLLVAPESMFGFRYIGLNRAGENPDGSPCVISLYEDGERLWVGTDGGGLYCLHRRDGTTDNWRPDNSGLSDNTIMAVSRDKRGTLWIASFNNGLFYLDPQAGGTVRKFPDNGRIGSGRIRALTYDPERDVLYAGTHGAGLVVVDPDKKVVTGSVLNAVNRWVSALHIHNDLLWIGTYNGPQCYDPNTGLAHTVELLPDGAPARVYAICSEPDGTMWFGTGDGVIRLGADGRTRRLYTEQDGLVNNNVRDILLSASGELWISTENGLSRFSPATQNFTNYRASDGLQGNEFRSGAAFRSPDSDRMYFGGTSGITVFRPRLVDRGTRKVPQVSLSRLTMLDREVDYDPAPGSSNLIDKHLPDATQILIPTDVDLFSVEFSVPEYTNPQRIVYDYRLRGFDSEWKTAPARLRMATYTNVPPGRYSLEVKAYFEGAPEDFSLHTVNLRVAAPWYLKGGAFAFYFILLAALAFFVSRRLAERRQRRQAAQEAELKELRLGLFTNLTHEIRTPLTLVMGPLRTLREAEQDPARKDTYNLMYRNCLRINRLVNQLMDLRKIDAGQMPVHFRETDIIYFIKDIMQSFEDLARTKRIDFSIASAHEEESLWIDQGNFDKIIFNILSNAFKHTPDGGRIRIGVSAPKPNRGQLQGDIREFVEVEIFNSGSRIGAEFRNRIFDRFVQLHPQDASSGSGVGLNLTKMLVELHHGRISADDLDDGVVFRVLIPAGKRHLTARELSDTSHHKDLYVKDSTLRRDEHEDATFARKPETEVRTDRTRKSLIVVEDDAETREYLKSLLRSGYNVTACADALEAWPLITTTMPDAVVSDLVMPGMNGSELCARIRQNPATNHIPVIILTGENGEREQQTANESGADKFLAKPVSVELLLSCIAQVISARETVRSKFSAAMEYDYENIRIGSADEKLMRRIVESIQRNLEDPDFDVAALCKDVGISRVHLNRKLKENGNVPPSVLIKSFRMKQAAYLLAYNKVNVSEVAFRIGFSSLSYFSSSFKEFFGMTPREFTSRFAENPDDEQLKKLFE